MKILTIIIVLISIISCNEIYKDKRQIVDGSKIFMLNCAPCHSVKDDTLFSKLNILNLSKMDSNYIDLNLSDILNNKVHKYHITFAANKDSLEAIKYYLRHNGYGRPVK